MNKPKRNHHIVPQLYLKGFVIKKDEPLIWVYKRGQSYNPGNGKITDNPFKDSIKSAGAERDFYADHHKDGTKDFETFENVLESLDKSANPIFHKLRTHQAISHEEKRMFSRYITLMYRRVKSGREKVKDLLAKDTYEPSKKLFQKTNWPDTPESRAEIKRVSKLMAQRDGFDIQTHNRITVDSPNSLMNDALQEMTWSFYIAPEPHAFLTCDNPVFISEKFGLGKNVSELSFPISTGVALVASWNRALREGFSEGNPRLLKEINRRTVSNASERVYFSQSQKWVADMFKRNLQEYRPIYSAKSIYTVAKIITEPDGSQPRVEIAI